MERDQTIPQEQQCNDLKLELRLHLGKDLRKCKRLIEVVKHKDTGMYLCYLYESIVQP